MKRKELNVKEKAKKKTNNEIELHFIEQIC